MKRNIVSIEKEYYADDLHLMWATFFREQRHNLPHSRSEAYLRSCEDNLAANIATAVTNYNNGILAASELIAVVGFYQRGEL